MLYYSNSKGEYSVDPNNLADISIRTDNVWTIGICQDSIIIHILDLSFWVSGKFLNFVLLYFPVLQKKV